MNVCSSRKTCKMIKPMGEVEEGKLTMPSVEHDKKHVKIKAKPDPGFNECAGGQLADTEYKFAEQAPWEKAEKVMLFMDGCCYPEVQYGKYHMPSIQACAVLVLVQLRGVTYTVGCLTGPVVTACQNPLLQGSDVPAADIAEINKMSVPIVTVDIVTASMTANCCLGFKDIPASIDASWRRLKAKGSHDQEVHNSVQELQGKESWPADKHYEHLRSIVSRAYKYLDVLRACDRAASASHCTGGFCWEAVCRSDVLHANGQSPQKS